MVWNPTQYEKFREERAAPFFDLIALGQFRPGQRIVDLGCGTGELTARLLALSPGASVLGIDSSADMLARALPLAGPGLRFAQASIEDYIADGAAPPDMLFSHAALQWVDDHPALFARLAAYLPEGGQLLVQMPSNHDHTSHAVVRQVVGEPPWRDRLGGYLRRSPVLGIAQYAELLFAQGFAQPVVLEKVYGHTLPDAQAVLEWVRGTLLVPYLAQLDDGEQAAFLRQLSERFAAAMPARPYYYAFRRILIAATRTSA
jgi:trans-aconitate 2-methyltransferase